MSLVDFSSQLYTPDTLRKCLTKAHSEALHLKMYGIVLIYPHYQQTKIPLGGNKEAKHPTPV